MYEARQVCVFPSLLLQPALSCSLASTPFFTQQPLSKAHVQTKCRPERYGHQKGDGGPLLELQYKRKTKAPKTIAYFAPCASLPDNRSYPRRNMRESNTK